MAHPELLEDGLTLVGRQAPTAGGWLDLLGVDRDGRLVIFELKRGSLGRDAVTQVLDYASAISAKSVESLNPCDDGFETDSGMYRVCKEHSEGVDRGCYVVTNEDRTGNAPPNLRRCRFGDRSR